MTINIVQTAVGTAPNAAVFAAPVTPGNAIIAGCSYGAGAGVSPTVSGVDAGGNAMSQVVVRAGAQNASQNGYHVSLWLLADCPARITTITPTTNSGSSGSTGIFCLE